MHILQFKHLGYVRSLLHSQRQHLFDKNKISKISNIVKLAIAMFSIYMYCESNLFL